MRKAEFGALIDRKLRLQDSKNKQEALHFNGEAVRMSRSFPIMSEELYPAGLVSY